ncbi:hypothetical protein BD410DRAFT_785963 [Rickenella mellea]|uniref:Uncharacterized protein n=1 Tax=Rickenella mellea TaxID=50990 RepID=A0A4Y7QAT4_9AGAM|nr:hypothetical protein BD410DRAFT_785963 [Rickenella mellea]
MHDVYGSKRGDAAWIVPRATPDIHGGPPSNSCGSHIAEDGCRNSVATVFALGTAGGLL